MVGTSAVLKNICECRHETSVVKEFRIIMPNRCQEDPLFNIRQQSVMGL